MKNENNYLKNTLILSLGKFATQFISIILIPLFTRYLPTDEYGYIDLIQTYINLFIPVFLLCFDTALFRFLIDKRNNDLEIKKIISNAFVFLMLQISAILIIFAIINKFINIKYGLYTILNLVILMLSNMLFQTCRGLGNNKDYSISTMIIAFLNLVTNVILIIFLNVGAESILISSIIGNFVAVIFLAFRLNLFKKIKIEYYEKKIIKEMLSYSIPMIPNMLSWWIVNVSDRTIISLIISTAANGIYTISCKFSNIVNSIFSIFIMSWQESASIHINDKDKDEFFSKNINETLLLFSSIVVISITGIPLIFNIAIGENYANSYNYIPILLISCIFSVLTSMLGGVYVAKKQTKEVAKTSFFAAIINIIINILLMKKIGIYAACISTLISYLLMSIYRMIDVKKYVSIRLDYQKMLFLLIVLFISCTLYYLRNNMLLILLLIVEIFVVLIINKSFLNDFVYILRKKLKNK